MPIPRSRAIVLACCAAGLSVAGAGALSAQEAAPRADYFDTLRELPPAGRDSGAAPQVVPLTSRFVLNGDVMEHGAKGFFSFGGQNGGPLRAEGTYAFATSLSEGLEGNLYARNQSGWYLQFGTVDRRRTITTTRRDAGRLSGTEVSLTITGGCLAPGSAPGTYCSYTPGIVVDETGVDPDTLLPTRFVLNSGFGAEIRAETHAALKLPGFQRGVAGDAEQIGIVADLPNVGFLVNSNVGLVRDEDIKTRGIAVLSRVEQNLYSNDTGASIDRTIRGFVLLREDEWTREAAALQLAGWLLPAMTGRLSEGAGGPNLRIGNNLFFAANNTRLPRDSFTVYHSSVSTSTHGDRPARSASETPVAWSRGLWLGFTPVRTIRTTGTLAYTPTGPRTVVESDFAQGGTSDAFGRGFDGGITIIDAVTGQIREIVLSNIDELFVQNGVSITTQDAIRTLTGRETSTYRYVPHLSFSGNRTSGTSVLRYYTGVILDDGANAYVGGDYTVNTESRWSAYVRADFFSKPDRDHYSALEARVNRTVEVAPGQNLTLGVAGLMELDRPDGVGEVPKFGDGANAVDLLARHEVDGAVYTLRRRFSDIGTVSEANSTTIGMSFSLTPRLGVSLQVTPHSTEDSYIHARAGVSWRLGDEADAPTFDMQWATINYDYGFNEVGDPLKTSEQTVLASLRMRF